MFSFSKFFSNPHMLMVELTNLCNLRCRMCGIWEEKPKKTMEVAALDDALSQRAMQSLKVIALTGGEPFLVHNLFDYYQVARRRRPRAHINISSNGYYTDRTLEFLARAREKNLSITISYDGVRSHDEIRGVEGSAARLLETARRVKREFPANPVSLKLTAMAENHEEITDTARQCRGLGIPFRFKTLEKLQCHQSRFPSPIQGPNYDATIVRSIATQAREVLDMGVETNRAYLTDLLKLYDGEETGCSCSLKTMFLGFDGNVFLCRKKDPIGNVLEQPLDAVWDSEQKHAIVAQMKACGGAADTLGFRHR
jgi:Fe-coproporphyrin III synthase